jgi:hypothetical protein
VDFQNHRALIEKAKILVGVFDRARLAAGQLMQELATLLAFGHVRHQVERLAYGLEGAIQQIVIVSRHDHELAAE